MLLVRIITLLVRLSLSFDFSSFRKFVLADIDLFMRLLHLENNGGFSLVEHIGGDIPKYAILSHKWGPEHEEVTFEDLTERTGKNKVGYRKLTFCAKQASRDGLQCFWVDTCCIDKSSSAELSEAINSMFRWYQNAERCYVYLSDVSRSISDRNGRRSWKWKREFKKSEWFTRGWTLQELLAPREVIFYDRQGNTLGTKSEHARWISKITAIDAEALVKAERSHGTTERLSTFSIAQRMSWASRRITTRTEDTAYCLLGIFNVNMPLLYGEGERAFIRLQEEILRNCCDDSILAWGLDAEARYPLVPDIEESSSRSPILASSPKDFESCGNLVCATARDSPFSMTNLGLEIQLPMVPICSSRSGNTVTAPNKRAGWIGLLSCSPGTDTELVGIILFSSVLGANPNQHVQRANIWRDELSYDTVIVGIRVAARSVVQKVTIVLEEETPRSRGYLLGCRQIVINESQAFQGTGYHIRNGTGLNMSDKFRLFGYRSSWDPEKLLLTIEDNRMSQDLLKFCFESQWNWPRTSFTIFLRTASKRAIVRRGSSFSQEDVRGFYDTLDEGYQDSLDKITITDLRNESFRVVVTIDEVTVYGWRIFEVNIDAQQVISSLAV